MTRSQEWRERLGGGSDRMTKRQSLDCPRCPLVLDPPVIRRMSLVVLGSSLRFVQVLKTTITSRGLLVLK